MQKTGGGGEKIENSADRETVRKVCGGACECTCKKCGLFLIKVYVCGS